MFTFTFDRLVKGDSSIVERYQRAMEIWDKIWDDPKSGSAAGLGQLLSKYQTDFERCGGYLETGTGHEEMSFGQEIMVVTGFLQFILPGGGFIDDEAEAKAKLLSDAFDPKNRGSCSVIASGMTDWLGLTERIQIP